jgi:hypothetical protein
MSYEIKKNEKGQDIIYNKDTKRWVLKDGISGAAYIKKLNQTLNQTLNQFEKMKISTEESKDSMSDVEEDIIKSDKVKEAEETTNCVASLLNELVLNGSLQTRIENGVVIYKFK